MREKSGGEEVKSQGKRSDHCIAPPGAGGGGGGGVQGDTLNGLCVQS